MKSNVIARGVSLASAIKIGDHTLDVADEFTHLDSTISMYASHIKVIPLTKGILCYPDLFHIWHNCKPYIKNNQKLQ